MRLYNILLIMTFIMLSALLAGCEKNPFNAVDENRTSIVVNIADELGNPVKEASVYTYPGTVRHKTNENGRAMIDGIPARNYTVYCEYFDSERNIRLRFEKYVVLKKNQKIEINFKFPAEITLKILVMTREPVNYEEYPIMGSIISTNPETVTMETNKNGYAIFENIPLGKYEFKITKKDKTYTKQKYLLFNNVITDEIIFIIDLIPPEVKIISPDDNQYQNNYNVHLIGEGTDFEDEELPESALTWYSDTDGELGTGRELMIDHLNIGHQTITLVGIDSDKIKHEDSIKLNLYFFNEDSYFPMPLGGYWNYLYGITEFSFVNDIEETEYWTLDHLDISTDDINTRKSLMDYTITKGYSAKKCRYYVLDYFETAGDNIYVSKTTEQLIIYAESTRINELTEKIEIETVYSPRYMLIKNHMDPLSESSYETYVSADINWSYYQNYYLSKSFRETINVETYYKFGASESVETNLGTFEALTLTITTGEAVRKWWLAKGIGIVKLEFNTFEFPLTATLYDTNIFSFAEENQAEKIAFPPSTSGRFRKECTSPQHTPERMLELCRFLRALCPQ